MKEKAKENIQAQCSYLAQCLTVDTRELFWKKCIGNLFQWPPVVYRWGSDVEINVQYINVSFAWTLSWLFDFAHAGCGPLASPWSFFFGSPGCIMVSCLHYNKKCRSSWISYHGFIYRNLRGHLLAWRFGTEYPETLQWEGMSLSDACSCSWRKVFFALTDCKSLTHQY